MRKDVIDLARQNVSEEKQSFEQALANADAIRKQYEEKLEEVSQEKQLLQEQRLKTEKLNGSLQKERDKLLDGSRKEAQKIVDKAAEQAEEIVRELKELLKQEGLSDKDLFAARAKAKQLKQITPETPQEEVIFTGDKVDAAKIKIGDVYYSKKWACR